MLQRAVLTLGALLLVGCLPVEVERPACFVDEPCPGDDVCVEGRCQAPPVRALEVRLDGCLGAAGSACRAQLEPRLAFDAVGARACLVIDAIALDARWDPDRGLHPAGAPDIPLQLALPIDRALDTGLFFLEEDAACDPGLLLADGCSGERGCVFALRRPGWRPPDSEPAVLGLADGGCAAVWGPNPPVELCDGRDEDCDGEADQTFPVGAECTVGRGGCSRAGRWRCAPDGRTAVCDGVPGAPMPETADGTDEDCDATIDEGLPGCDLEASRACGTDDGVCTVGTQRCAEDGTFGACLGPDEVPIVTPGSRQEVCDDRDDDCDGRVDEGAVIIGEGPDRPVLAVGDPCPLTDDCPVLGVVDCGADGSARCVPGPDAPPVEACNGLDDDCDADIDEDWPDKGEGCSAGIGGCAREGTLSCTGDGLGVACDAVVGAAEAEICGNRLDEDCDGAADEDFPTVGEVCAVGQGACAVEGAIICDPVDAYAVSCGVVPIDPAPEACNGVDDDCDGLLDEDFDLTADVDNCGRCGRICSGENATPICDGGFCALDCDPGYSDGDGLAENGCECNEQQLDEPDPEALEPGVAVDIDCDGIDGERDAAIYASARFGDDIADGAPATPVRTLGRAIALASPLRQPIYLDLGRFELRESQVVPAGVDLHGGYQYDPDSRTWSATRARRDQGQTVIAGPPRPLIYVELDQPTLLDRVVIQAGSADGISSVAVTAIGVGEHLFVRDSTLRPGVGGSGRLGDNGEPGPDVAEAGGNGFPGNVAVDPGGGGPGGANPECVAEGGRGGRGGGQDVVDPEPVPAERGEDGVAGGGRGGAGGVALADDGEDGGHGPSGSHGANGEADGGRGRFVAGNWTPGQSADGVRGGPGFGGGGGGGGMWSGDRATRSGGGGGGGAGGCAGSGGGAADGGGASVALLVAGGRVALHNCRLEPAAGGTGGIGGAGGTGAPGRPGGLGRGHATCLACGRGGDGGDGGDGGCGGHGGGGAGGPSFAVLRVGREADPDTDHPEEIDRVGVVMATAFGVPLAEPEAIDLAIIDSMDEGTPGPGGSGGSRPGCGPSAADGPDGPYGRIGCCTLDAGDRCRLLEPCP